MRDITGASIRTEVFLRVVDTLGYLTGVYEFKGYYRLSKLVGTLIPGDEECTVKLATDSKFCFCASDPYWNRLVHKSYYHEREIVYVLELYKNAGYLLIDGGANLGIFSVLATSDDYGKNNAVAIEPIKKTFRLLDYNKHINNNRFFSINCALSSISGKNVVMKYKKTETASASGATMSDVRLRQMDRNDIWINESNVKTVTVDELVRNYRINSQPIIVKLDVEGVEVDAIKGSEKTLNEETLLIYEDHGIDSSCIVTEHVISMGLEVFYINNMKGIKRIIKKEDAQKEKRYKGRGYNFFATLKGGYFYKILNQLSKEF